VPMNDKKSAHLEQTHMTSLKRAFAVSSEQRQIPMTKTTARIYPRRTVASRPTTPAPVVHIITSANSQPQNNTPHMHATQLAAVQREIPSYNDGTRDSLRDGSKWFSDANGSTQSQKQWPRFGEKIDASSRAFDGSSIHAIPNTSWMRVPPAPLPQFQPAHIQSQNFMPTQ
uniref:Uncharacterized protein n=1 Tax=Parascaris univalens TaxID=6257 RepID=A0A915A6I1_PARUN